MQPSEVLRRVRHDHEGLRARVSEIETLAKNVMSGDEAQIGKLLECGKALTGTLAQHMRWEDLYLAPALEDADAWGPERAALLAEDHREQREVLARLIDSLEDPQEPASVLATNLVQFAHHLMQDMEEEEASFVNSNVLRDDVIGIDVEGG